MKDLDTSFHQFLLLPGLPFPAVSRPLVNGRRDGWIQGCTLHIAQTDGTRFIGIKENVQKCKMTINAGDILIKCDLHLIQ